MFIKFVGRIAFVAAVLVFACAAPARAEWWEAESAHFVVKSEASEVATRRYAFELEQFDRVLRLLQGMPTDGEVVGRSNKPTIYRYGRAVDVARIYGEPGSAVAGFFIPRAGASVGFAPTKNDRITSRRSASMVGDERFELDPRSVLFHEYTHYFMMQHFPGAYPRWYVEGFAELMATTRIDDDRFHVGDPPQYRAYQIFRMQDFPLEEMLDPDHRLTHEDAMQHYATGWLFTHYMSFDPGRRERLVGYLREIARGENGLDSAKREFGDLQAIEADLRKYKRGPFPGFDISGQGVEPKIAMRRLTNSEEDSIRSEMRLARGPIDEGDARDLVSDLTAAAASSGNAVHVLGLLGQAQIAAKQYADAEDTGARIVAADPDDETGWLVRSGAAIGLAKGNPAKGAAAREFATRAAQLDRSDPRPLIDYYLSYVRTGEPPTEIAVTALETAYAHAGSDSDYRLLVTYQSLLDNKLDLARQVLMPIAFNGHRTVEPKSENDPTPQRILALINSGNRDDALAMASRMISKDEFDKN